MRATTKTNRDGSEQVLLGKLILKEKPARKRDRRVDWQFSLETLRLREIEAVIRHRHGNGIPDPNGSDDVDISSDSVVTVHIMKYRLTLALC